MLSRDGKAKLVGLDSPFFQPMDRGIADPIVGRIAYMARDRLTARSSIGEQMYSAWVAPATNWSRAEVRLKGTAQSM